jgi:frizzled 1/7
MPNLKKMNKISIVSVFLVLSLFEVSLQEEDHEVSGGLSGSENPNFPHHGLCEPVTIPLCLDIQYNTTIMPNLFGHSKQEEAALEVHQFVPLVKVHCSPDLKFFLCSLYAPPCTILPHPIPPCRSLCESARVCESIMKTFDFDWPENLECTKFPLDGSGEICIAQNATGSTQSPGSAGGAGGGGYYTQKPTVKRKPTNRNPGGGMAHRDIGFVCPVQLKVPSGMGYQLTVGNKVSKNQNPQTGTESTILVPQTVIRISLFILLCDVESRRQTSKRSIFGNHQQKNPTHREREMKNVHKNVNCFSCIHFYVYLPHDDVVCSHKKYVENVLRLNMHIQVTGSGRCHVSDSVYFGGFYRKY